MNLSKYKACICEGAGEAAIIDILVDASNHYNYSLKKDKSVVQNEVHLLL